MHAGAFLSSKPAAPQVKLHACMLGSPFGLLVWSISKSPRIGLLHAYAMHAHHTCVLKKTILRCAINQVRSIITQARTSHDIV